jgi:uncharacterized protein YciI
MFIVELTYKVELAIVDQFVESHRVWLDDMYKNNYFLCSGAKVPRNGGIIIALVKSHDILNKLLSQDPFYINKIADYRVIEFATTKYHNNFAKFIGLI